MPCEMDHSSKFFKKFTNWNSMTSMLFGSDLVKMLHTQLIRNVFGIFFSDSFNFVIMPAKQWSFFVVVNFWRFRLLGQVICWIGYKCVAKQITIQQERRKKKFHILCNEKLWHFMDKIHWINYITSNIKKKSCTPKYRKKQTLLLIRYGSAQNRYMEQYDRVYSILSFMYTVNTYNQRWITIRFFFFLSSLHCINDGFCNVFFPLNRVFENVMTKRKRKEKHYRFNA